MCALAPRSKRNEKKSIKWKLLLFDESDFFLLRPIYFLFSFNTSMLFILSQSRNVYVFKKTPDYQIGLKITYINLCIVKKAKLEISGSHR